MKPYYDRDGITIYNADSAEFNPPGTPCEVILYDPPWPWEGKLGPQRAPKLNRTTIIFGVPTVESMLAFGYYEPSGVTMWIPDQNMVQAAKTKGNVAVPIWYWGNVKCPVVLREP